MTIIDGDRAAAVDPAGLVDSLFDLRLTSTSGDVEDCPAAWRVVLYSPGPGRLSRKVWVKRLGGPEECWAGDDLWDPELDIWPAWHHKRSAAERESGPLETAHRNCSGDADRLRDAAKWMATVMGLSLAALVGTSPLNDMQDSAHPRVTLALAGCSLVLLAVALVLVLRVLRLQPVSFIDLQKKGGALRRWRERVESEQDLYLPCGIKCLSTLRQSLIAEEVTVNALEGAINTRHGQPGAAICEEAIEARIARLVDLRAAAAHILAVADYYRLGRLSAWATYVGGPCGVLATAGLVAAFLL